MQSRSRYSAGSHSRSTLQSRGHTAALGPRGLRLTPPQQEMAMRATQLLNSISWTSVAKDGAPEAWQVRRKSTKKSNSMLRKELAHISHLRDTQRQSGAQSAPPPAWNGPALPASGEYAGDILGGGMQGRNAQMTAELPARGGRNHHGLHRSCSSTPSHVPSRPATSMSVKGHIPACFALSNLHDGAMTPNTIRVQRRIELLGTESRPNSGYKVLKRRQPQAEMHMVWSAGPKKFDEYNEEVQEELFAEQKAATIKRKSLIKTVCPHPYPLLSL